MQPLLDTKLVKDRDDSITDSGKGSAEIEIVKDFPKSHNTISLTQLTPSLCFTLGTDIRNSASKNGFE